MRRAGPERSEVKKTSSGRGSVTDYVYSLHRRAENAV
jgi:hypothetical protein